MNPELYPRAAVEDAEITGWPTYLVRAAVVNRMAPFKALLERTRVSNGAEIDIDLLRSIEGKQIHDWSELYPSDTNIGIYRSGGATSLLHVVCHLRRKEMIELLLANGAEITASDFRGRTPLLVAAEQGNMIALPILLAHNPIGINGSVPLGREFGLYFGPTNLLHCAVLGNQPAAVQFLLDNGAEPRLSGSLWGHSCRDTLFMAAFYGHAEVLQQLLDCGSYDSSSLNRALHVACVRENHVREAKFCLDAGATPCENAVRSVLGYYRNNANARERLEILKMIVDKGLERNSRRCPEPFPNHEPDDCLEVAAAEPIEGFLPLLLSSGKYNRQEVSKVLTAVCMPSHPYRLDASRVKMLVDAGATSLEANLQRAIKDNDLELVRVLSEVKSNSSGPFQFLFRWRLDLRAGLRV